MEPTDILDDVTTAVDRAVEAGEPYNGLIPSILDRETAEMLRELPESVFGQRQHDRARLGCNPVHDEPLLRTMYDLAEALNRPKYEAAADRYLEYFATECTETASGLFPWGEHAFWHLEENRVGDSLRIIDPDHERPIHDHLRQVPRWMWEKLYEFNPACVHGFAEGLDYHWCDPHKPKMNRHAPITDTERMDPGEGPTGGSRFPGTAGFYIFDWAFAHSVDPHDEYAQQIRKATDHWWKTRESRGILPLWNRGTRYDELCPGQTIGHAARLLESAELLDDIEPDLADLLRDRSSVYVDGFLSAPHDIENGVFAFLTRPIDREITHPPRRGRILTAPIWESTYGGRQGRGGHAARLALLCLCSYRLTNDDRLLEWARGVGKWYLREPFPAPDTENPATVIAGDAGHALDLLADLYDLTGEAHWLDGGLDFAEECIDVYLDAALPRGASSIDWYEGQMGPGFLLHGLARIALLARDNTCLLEANYTDK